MAKNDLLVADVDVGQISGPNPLAKEISVPPETFIVIPEDKKLLSD